jgi:hypothetical protein
MNQLALIKVLNPVIRGWLHAKDFRQRASMKGFPGPGKAFHGGAWSWSNYFGAFESNTMHFLTKMDYFTYLKIRHWLHAKDFRQRKSLAWSWAKRVKGTSGKAVSYFHKVGNDKWTFCVKDGPALLRHFKSATASSRIVKTRGNESPYSGNEKYWLHGKSSASGRLPMQLE